MSAELPGYVFQRRPWIARVRTHPDAGQTMRDRIRLKNSGDLWIENSLASMITERPDERSARFTNWRERGITFLILNADEDETNTLHFIEAVREAGFVVRVVPPEVDFGGLERLRADILREIKSGTGLITGDSKKLETFIALLLVLLKKRTIAPEDAVAFASERTDFQPGDRVVYEFKRYLDPTYRIPDHVSGDLTPVGPPVLSRLIRDLESCTWDPDSV